MKAERPYPQVHITPKCQRALQAGHPWVYAGEVTELTGPVEDGGLADIIGSKGAYLGTGFYNSHSLIRCRLLSRNANDRFDDAFWQRRVQYAWDYRKSVMPPEDLLCCRVIFGEADGFPGLTVDRFGPVLVAQVLSLGMERIQQRLLPLLAQVLRRDGQDIAGIYLRNDVALREKEGLAQGKGWFPLPGEEEPTLTESDIVENGIRYRVDFINGQKTGFFLDQKYNRLAAGRLAEGKTVLDCFTHTGAFALNCAAAGAKHVCAVDISKDAIELTRKNARLNNLDNVSFECANVFEMLTSLYESKTSVYDYIILDPPAFTKSSSCVHNAERGYKEINMKAMKLLPRGGYLATCSCSHFMMDELFKKMLRSAAADAGVSLRQIEARQQSPDHPILWSVPETDYLKFYIFQVV